MASSLVRSQKSLRKSESKKSHSWWWDSHVSPKNSKWLAENLEEMDQSVKRMLKLIEEDGDSFAKKAEMYYQKRPELIAHVEEFYRMYRSLAERYDNVTGELRKNMPSDLRSQSSGISDVSSELPTPLPSSDQRLGRRSSGPRAAGFDVFLKTAESSSDLTNKEGDETSTLDSDSDSDDSSVNNYSSASGNSEDRRLRKKITELEVELRNAKEKLQVQQDENSGESFKGSKNGNSELVFARISKYEEELRVAKEKIQGSEEEVEKLRHELKKYESLKSADIVHTKVDDSHEHVESVSNDLELEEENNEERNDGVEAAFSDEELKIQALQKELKVTKERLFDSEEEVRRLRREIESNGSSNQNLVEKLGLAQKDISSWKSKFDKEKREASKLQDRITRYKANLSERDQEIRALRETVSNANKSLSEENLELQAEITKLTKERVYLEDSLKEWDLRCQCLEEDLRRVKVVKTEMEAEIEQLKAEIYEKHECIEELNTSLDELKLQREEFHAKISLLSDEAHAKDVQIGQMSKHLDELHIEHVELVSGIEKARKTIDELTSKGKELEMEIERQREVIEEGAERKREAIRQLCFSLEHYRNGYQMLRKAFVGHKRFPVMAS